MAGGNGFGGLVQVFFDERFAGPIVQHEQSSGNLRAALDGKKIPTGVGIYDGVVGFKIW